MSDRSSDEGSYSRHFIQAAVYLAFNAILFVVFLVAAILAPLGVGYISWNIPTHDALSGLGFCVIGIGGFIGSVLTTITMSVCCVSLLSTPTQQGLTRDERVRSLVRRVTDAVGVAPFAGVIVAADVGAYTFYTARGRYLTIGALLLKYHTTDELAAIVAHECAHHHYGAMLLNRVHHRARGMFFSYCQAILRAMTAIDRLPFLRPATLPMLALVPLIKLYGKLIALQDSKLRNAAYEFYCDSIAAEFAGANVFAVALLKVLDLQLAHRLANERQGLSYLDELDRQFNYLRTSDPPLRSQATKTSTATHPSISERLSRLIGPTVTDDSRPLYDDGDLRTLWSQHPAPKAATALASADAELDVVRASTPSSICYFCRSDRADAAQAINVVMHGHIRAVPVDESSDVTRNVWDTHTLQVPRCIECGRAHRAVERVRNLALTFGFLSMMAFGFSSAWWTSYAPSGVLVPVVFAAGEAILFAAMVVLCRNIVRIHLGSRAEEDTKFGSATIQGYAQRGWRLGKAPSAAASSIPPPRRPIQWLDFAWLGERKWFRGLVRKQRHAFTMATLWLPMPFVVGFIPALWLFSARTPAAILDLVSVGLLDKAGALKDLTTVAVDAHRAADLRLAALNDTDLLHVSSADASQATLANLEWVMYGSDALLARIGRDLLLRLAPLEVAERTDIQYLASTDANIRTRAANNLGSLGPGARHAAAPLLTATEDPDPVVRKASTAALVATSPSASVPVLVKQLADPDRNVRFTAASFLFQGSGATPEVVSALQSATGDSDAAVRDMARLALRHLGSMPVP